MSRVDGEAPAALCADIERVRGRGLRHGQDRHGRSEEDVRPGEPKARDLSRLEEFGDIALVRAGVPAGHPDGRSDDSILERREHRPRRRWFLDHLCHPGSLLQLLLGPPQTLFYRRAHSGAGVVLLTYEGGIVAELALTHGNAFTDGLERTVITSGRGRHIVVENNTRVAFHRIPVAGYGDVPDFYTAPVEKATAVWQPEFSLGQLYNKGSFLLGYYGELAEFAAAVLECRQPCNGTLDDAWHVTRLFEAFGRGPGVTIDLDEVRLLR